MQLNGVEGIFSTASALIRSEGSASLFRSLPVTYAMNVPFAGFFVTFNENLKSLCLTQQSTSVCAYFACPEVSGSLAAILTTPFDVVKTRMQTQDTQSSLCKQRNKPWTRPVYCSIKATAKQILAEEGWVYIRGCA
jgi:hypothetical protein